MTWAPAFSTAAATRSWSASSRPPITTILSIVLALLAAYFGGAPDWIISRFFDLIWAFPVILLGIALGTALSINGFHHTIIPSFWIFPAGRSTSPPAASGSR